MRFELILGLASALALAGAPHARAQANPSEAEAVAMLNASDADTVRLGIETLGLSGTPSAVSAIVARTQRGLPAELLDVALTTLRVLGRPATAPLLAELSHHRRAEVRLRALEALAATHDASAPAVLAAALDDSNPAVRAAAALGFLEVGSHDDVARLLRAFDRGTHETAAAIGRLGDADDVRRLSYAAGRARFSDVAPGFTAALLRTDLPLRLRLDLVARLEELGTAEIRTYLEALLVSLPTTPTDPVRRAVEESISRIAG